jgi:hypothetical protein
MTNIQLIRENSEGARAQQHYDYLKPIIDVVREEMRQQWFETKPAQAATREHIWRALHALDEIENKIISVINTGKLAAFSLSRGETNERR